MHDVYNHAYCNIAATAAADPTVGLFFDRPNVPPPSRITVKWNGDHDNLRGKTSTANTLSSTPTSGPVKLPYRLSCNEHGSSKSGSWRFESCTLLRTNYSGNVAPYKQVRTIPTAYQNSLKRSSIAISDPQPEIYYGHLRLELTRDLST